MCSVGINKITGMQTPFLDWDCYQLVVIVGKKGGKVEGGVSLLLLGEMIHSLIPFLPSIKTESLNVGKKMSISLWHSLLYWRFVNIFICLHTIKVKYCQNLLHV